MIFVCTAVEVGVVRKAYMKGYCCRSSVRVSVSLLRCAIEESNPGSWDWLSVEAAARSAVLQYFVGVRWTWRLLAAKRKPYRYRQ